jgi:hypothetical protein
MLKAIVIFVIAFIAVCFIFLGIENNISPSFNKCVAQYFAYSEAICTLRLIDQHNGFFSMVAALVVACLTSVLAWAAIDQHQHNREVERAYLSAGGGTVKVKIIDGDSEKEKTQFLINVSNHGRTNATIKSVHWGFCDDMAIWQEPIPNNNRGYDDLIAPNHRDRGLFLVDIDGSINDPVIFGEVVYHDIWGHEFYSRFAQYVFPKAFGENLVDAPPSVTRRT